MAGIAQLNDNEFWDIDSFINWPEDGEEAIDYSSLQAATAADPLIASLSQSGLGLAAELGFDPLTTDFPLYDNGYPSPSPTVNYPLAPSPQDFRPVVDSLAAGDARLRSWKEKRRDAAIDVHLQRATNDFSWPLPVDAAASSDAFSSTYSPESMQEGFAQRSRSATASVSQTTPGSSSTRSEQWSDSSPSGSLELVLDLNMNAATELPRKQRKRTKAEIDDYTNVRRNGACIKHKKQHKKCNCLDKIASPAITKLKTKNRSLDKRAPVRERSLQALEQSSRPMQPVSSQLHTTSQERSQAWPSFEEALASLPDVREAQLSLSRSSPHPTTQQHSCICRNPRCTLPGRCTRIPKEHYNVHHNLWRHGSSQPLETSIHERHIQQNPEPQLGHTRKPLDLPATWMYLDTGSSVPAPSAQSTSRNSQERPESRQATASVPRGVNGAFQRPPNERHVSGNTPTSISSEVPMRITPWTPSEMLLGTRSVQEATVAHGILRDRRAVPNEILQPRERHEQLRVSQQLATELSGSEWSRGAPAFQTNTYLPTARSLPSHELVNTDVIGSILQVHQTAAVGFGVATAAMAVTQMILVRLFAFIRLVQRIVLLQTWKSLTASFPVGRKATQEVISQLV